MASLIFDPQPPADSDHIQSDGKVVRFTDTNNILELGSDNADYLPQFPINFHLPITNILFDKVNAPFIATGYEIYFE